MFGRGELSSLRLQDHGIEEQQRDPAPAHASLPGRQAMPLVATNDAHYHQPGGQRHAAAFSSASRPNKTVNDPRRSGISDRRVLHQEHRRRCVRLFPHVPEAFENTVRIAERCNVEFEFGKTKLPYFAAPDGEDNLAYFRRMSYAGRCTGRYGENPDPSVTRAAGI